MLSLAPVVASIVYALVVSVAHSLTIQEAHSSQAGELVIEGLREDSSAYGAYHYAEGGFESYVQVVLTSPDTLTHSFCGAYTAVYSPAVGLKVATCPSNSNMGQQSKQVDGLYIDLIHFIPLRSDAGAIPWDIVSGRQPYASPQAFVASLVASHRFQHVAILMVRIINENHFSPPPSAAAAPAVLDQQRLPEPRWTTEFCPVHCSDINWLEDREPPARANDMDSSIAPCKPSLESAAHLSANVPSTTAFGYPHVELLIFQG